MSKWGMGLDRYKDSIWLMPTQNFITSGVSKNKEKKSSRLVNVKSIFFSDGYFLTSVTCRLHLDNTEKSQISFIFDFFFRNLRIWNQDYHKEENVSNYRKIIINVFLTKPVTFVSDVHYFCVKSGRGKRFSFVSLVVRKKTTGHFYYVKKTGNSSFQKRLTKWKNHCVPRTSGFCRSHNPCGSYWWSCPCRSWIPQWPKSLWTCFSCILLRSRGFRRPQSFRLKQFW